MALVTSVTTENEIDMEWPEDAKIEENDDSKSDSQATIGPTPRLEPRNRLVVALLNSRGTNFLDISESAAGLPHLSRLINALLVSVFVGEPENTIA
ncbi:hypothetical protein E1H12_01530 [Geitlerinema sp. P-1104]|uniref:hypothetical protein n=1 Tax=Geitlerinema sp. P-1104 TaxID=2546230 RepID=UPI0014778095|nr:hypothetical protein [Geitlerinema sp. P-1104]NMG57233.1 hypothetical protein [Geitlerinema sp. P-1104]